MAFDFRGGKRDPKPSNTSKSQDGYSSSLKSIPRPDEKRTSSSGFKSTPTIRNNSERSGGFSPSNFSVFNNQNKRQREPRKRPMRSGYNRRSGNFQIPWNILLPIIIVLVIVILLFVFKDVITSFLMQVLSWIVIVLIIIGIINWFIFPRHRR